MCDGRSCIVSTQDKFLLETLFHNKIRYIYPKTKFRNHNVVVFGENSVRLKFRSAKFPLDANSFRRKLRLAKFPSTNFPSAKISLAKIPVTILNQYTLKRGPPIYEKNTQTLLERNKS